MLNIISLSPKGRGLCQEGKIEVIGALPGEVIYADLGRKRKKKCLGFLRKIHTSSSERVSPQCSHVPECGGCSIQQMNYAAQLTFKQEKILKIFAPHCLQSTKIYPILGAENPWQYRNKMEFSFSQNAARQKFLGLIRAGSKGQVLNLEECFLVPLWFMQTLNNVRHWWESAPVAAYNFRNDEGHLRTLTLRQAKKGKMAILTVSGNSRFALKKQYIKNFIKAVQATVSKEEEQSLSIFLQIQQIAKGKPTQFFEMLLSGPDHITEELQIGEENPFFLHCKISPSSFFQPNIRQAEKLYSTAMKLLAPAFEKCIYDLYCGGGILGLCAAKVAQEVIGIEMNPHAVFDAKWNRETNHITNFSIHQGDVGEVLAKLKKENRLKKPDTVILDPPRSGLSSQALEEIKALCPKEILYISCNPLTQAANIEQLLKNDYILHTIQPLDQFPHTVHIENICLLKRK